MTTEGEHRGVVCGTCGERLIWSAITQTWRHAVYPGHMPDVRTATIPAPVVPSDDGSHERDEERWLLTPGKWQPEESASPTPSQDAEGDHEIEGFHWIDTECCVTCDEPVVHIEGRGWVHLSRVESAIRAPYEALVKAANEVVNDIEHGGDHARVGWGSLSRLDAALTRIEESLGVRS